MSTLTMDLALKICPGEKTTLMDFYKHGNKNEFIIFPFTNYVYNYLQNNELSYHKILLKCFHCNQKPEYSHGIGNIFLMHNDINENEFLTWNKETVSFQIIKNNKRYQRFICLCSKHVENLELYKKPKLIAISTPNTPKQLTLNL